MVVEVYEHGAGKLFILHSDKTMSTGALLLNPNTEFPKHNRPVLEQLTQVAGKCLIKLFENGTAEEIVLEEGRTLKIKPDQWHIHSNPYDKISVTVWKFEGDITEVINGLRKRLRRV